MSVQKQCSLLRNTWNIGKNKNIFPSIVLITENYGIMDMKKLFLYFATCFFYKSLCIFFLAGSMANSCP